MPVPASAQSPEAEVFRGLLQLSVPFQAALNSAPLKAPTAILIMVDREACHEALSCGARIPEVHSIDLMDLPECAVNDPQVGNLKTIAILLTLDNAQALCKIVASSSPQDLTTRKAFVGQEIHSGNRLEPHLMCLTQPWCDKTFQKVLWFGLLCTPIVLYIKNLFLLKLFVPYFVKIISKGYVSFSKYTFINTSLWKTSTFSETTYTLFIYACCFDLYNDE